MLCWPGYYALWVVGGFGPFGPVLDPVQLARGEPLVMLAWCVSMIAGATIGLLIVRRHPRNPIGWLVFAASGMVSLFTLAGEYAVMPLLRPEINWPGAIWLAWFAGGVNQGTAVIALLLLLFPGGRLVSNRWRPLAWLAVVSGVLSAIGRALLAGPLLDGPHFPSPVGLLVGGVWPMVLLTGSTVLVALALLGGGASLIVRYRGATSQERLQLKWIALAATVWIPLLVLNSVARDLLVVRVAMVAGVGAFVLALGAGVLRYRLYDVDLVINKALVYGALTVCVVAIYVVVVGAISAVLRSVNDTTISLFATGIVAVAFQPLRDRLQHLANRLVYGYRASPYEVMAAFSRRVGEAISVDEVLPRIVEAAWRGLGAAHTRVRLLGPDGVDRAVVWPPNTPHNGQFQHSVPVVHRGEFVGEIAIDKRPGEPLTHAESALLEDLASEAGPALHNVRLTLELQTRADELSRQAEELRASRQRLVTAQDTERRRLERDIHDGAQQSLVAMAVQLRLLKALLRKNPERAETLADELGNVARDALTELRNLARGIFPPLLADRGLPAALRSHVERGAGDVHLTMGADVEALRFAPEAETAIYFCIREALQNAAKHAPAARVCVTLRHQDGSLVVRSARRRPGVHVRPEYAKRIRTPGHAGPSHRARW